MSGGIDSTVAIHQLQQSGFEVIGATLNISLDGNKSITNVSKAAELASFFNIEHHVIELGSSFQNKVIDYFTQEYLKGRTPSPCVVCNAEIKMQYLYEYANKYNCNKIATGHYVNVIQDNGIFYITKGIDKQKEQSYFLWNLSQEILAKCVFPLGKLYKKDILKKAKNIGLNDLVNNNESMSICFLQSKDYRDFLDEQIPELKHQLQNGDILNSKGEIIGKHSGYPYYTIGQKRGLNLNSGTTNQYVAKIDSQNNRLITSSKQEIISKEVECDKFYFNNPSFISSSKRVFIRIRGFDYQEPTAGTICKKNNKLQVVFDTPVWAITPGQPMVFYVDNRVVGGAYV